MSSARSDIDCPGIKATFLTDYVHTARHIPLWIRKLELLIAVAGYHSNYHLRLRLLSLRHQQ